MPINTESTCNGFEDFLGTGRLKIQNQHEIDLKVFWELEELSIKDDSKNVTNEEYFQHFYEKFQYVNKRYEINLPWIRNWKQLEDDNLSVAEM